MKNYLIKCGDCLELLKTTPNNSIDITITSPPYNLGISYDIYNDNKPINEYVKWVTDLLSELYRVTKEGGRVCINIPPDIGTLKDGTKISLDTVYYNVLEKVGFKYRTKIVWNKNTITSRTAWGSFCSPSNPNILPSFEYILVFYKGSPKKSGKKELIDITKEEFIPWTNGLWNIASESAKKVGHPAPYPIELCDRLLKMFSYQEDCVFDPFLGSGTTGVSAIRNNRNFLGFEISEDYCNLAKKRLGEIN